jgi:hypothetical protein
MGSPLSRQATIFPVFDGRADLVYERAPELVVGYSLSPLKGILQGLEVHAVIQFL